MASIEARKQVIKEAARQVRSGQLFVTRTVRGKLMAVTEYGPIVDMHEALDALTGLYDILPRGSCAAEQPDGCAVCVARALLIRHGRKQDHPA